MVKRIILVVTALAAGFLLAASWPRAVDSVRAAWIAASGRPAAEDRAKKPAPEKSPPLAEPAVVKLAPDQIEKAGVRVAAVSGGSLARRLVVPGSVVPKADNTARIA